jgi:hypothetical protein
MIKRNSGGGSLPKIVGFAKIKNMAEGDAISGTYKGTLTTKGEYPKVNHLIELALPFSFSTFQKESNGNVVVDANAGEVVALETTAVLSAELSDNDKGKSITIVYEGKSKTKKPGQRPAYLVGVYDGLPEGGSEAAAPAAKPAARAVGAQAARPFPFNKN